MDALHSTGKHAEFEEIDAGGNPRELLAYSDDDRNHLKRILRESEEWLKNNP